MAWTVLPVDGHSTLKVVVNANNGHVVGTVNQQFAEGVGALPQFVGAAAALVEEFRAKFGDAMAASKNFAQLDELVKKIKSSL